ncbi:MAG: MBOAT family protein [Chloroflexi bacterium]|nr:MBOAT family protein [Chloroflexota bacterium]
MTFTSPEFVLFFAVFVPIYFITPQRLRWIPLLIASYFFYAYGSGIYVVLIIATTLIDYTSARLMTSTTDSRRRKLLLAASLTANLGTLFVFKYFNFFNQSFATLAHDLSMDYPIGALNVILPVGISFYTFQSMAYTIDVYRGTIAPEKHLGIFATFVAFFPQLVAGPIERAKHMLPQFQAKQVSQFKRFDAERAVAGLRLILWGAFKKIVIADRLAIYVNTVYNAPQQYSGLPLIVATIFFGFQIYGDFSAYSDIAIGAAKILGFDLMLNFRQPYFAQSVREFWARWHISLSTWFRDYLYIPLGGNRVPFARNLLNLVIVFLVSGLWHGASWTFVIWGALHSIYIVVETILHHYGVEFKLPALLKIAFTFGLITFAWIFFRANSFSDALYVVTHLFSFSGQSLTDPFADGLLGAHAEFIVSCVLIALLLGIDVLIERVGFEALWRISPLAVRWAAYYAAGAAVIFSGLYGTGAQIFIYFRF